LSVYRRPKADHPGNAMNKNFTNSRCCWNLLVYSIQGPTRPPFLIQNRISKPQTSMKGAPALEKRYNGLKPAPDHNHVQ